MLPLALDALVANLRPLKPRRLPCGDVGEPPVVGGAADAEPEPDGARSNRPPLRWELMLAEGLPWLLVVEDVHLRRDVELRDHRLRAPDAATPSWASMGAKPIAAAVGAADQRFDTPPAALSGDFVVVDIGTPCAPVPVNDDVVPAET